MAELKLKPSSRMKDTKLLEDSDGTVFWDMWEAPPEFLKAASGSQEHIVRGHQAGRLDMIAGDYYENPDLWWVIAHANSLINPIDEVRAGVTLIIPARKVVRQYTRRAGHG